MKAEGRLHHLRVRIENSYQLTQHEVIKVDEMEGSIL
jgi:hypothetical protein